MKGEPAQHEIDALLAEPGVTTGVLLARVLGTRAVGARSGTRRRWCTGAARGVAQSLFSSTLAVWRCKGAFLAYSLTWAAVIALFGAAGGGAVRPARRAAAGQRAGRAGGADLLDRVLHLAAVHLHRQLRRRGRPVEHHAAACAGAYAVSRPASAWRSPAPATCCRGGRSCTWARASAPLPFERGDHAFAELGVEHRLAHAQALLARHGRGRRHWRRWARGSTRPAPTMPDRPLPRCQACWYSRA